jgi:hypothetical protein
MRYLKEFESGENYLFNEQNIAIDLADKRLTQIFGHIKRR